MSSRPPTHREETANSCLQIISSFLTLIKIAMYSPTSENEHWTLGISLQKQEPLGYNPKTLTLYFSSRDTSCHQAVSKLWPHMSGDMCQIVNIRKNYKAPMIDKLSSTYKGRKEGVLYRQSGGSCPCFLLLLVPWESWCEHKATKTIDPAARAVRQFIREMTF